MEDFIKKYIRIIVLSVILLFALAFIVFYGTNDLFRFPFDSNVWGTFSDWSMVVVTLFTATYLIRTFNEQKRANDIQADQHFRKIFPKFEIVQNRIDINLINNDSYPEYSFSLRIELKFNDARNVVFDILNDKIIHSVFNIPYLKEGEKIDFELKSEITSSMNEQDVPVLNLSFEDIDGNRYFQQSFVKNNIIYFKKNNLFN